MRRGWKVSMERAGRNWRCRWRGSHGDGQLVFVSRQDARELAECKRQEFQRADAGLPPRPPEHRHISFGDMTQRYLDWLDSRRSARTRQIAGRALDLYRAMVGDRLPVREDVDTFSQALLRRYSPNAARIYLRHSKAAFRWALHQRPRLIEEDPFSGFEFPAPSPVARLVSPADMTAILGEVPDVVRRALVYMLYTGLRTGELVRLDWSDVQRDGDDWRMTVAKSKTRRAAPEKKTQAIHPSARAVMGEPREAGRVFAVSAGRLGQNLRRAVLKLKLPRTRLHDLRHTWATHLLQSAPDLRAVMEVGGWASVQAAMLYQHGTPERQRVTLSMRYDLAPSRPLTRRYRGEARNKIIK